MIGDYIDKLESDNHSLRSMLESSKAECKSLREVNQGYKGEIQTLNFMVNNAPTDNRDKVKTLEHDFELLQRAFVELGVNLLTGRELITAGGPEDV